MTPAQLYDGILKAMNDKGAIELIEEAKKEWEKEEIIKAKCLTEHLSQEERNEYFDLRLKEYELAN